MTRPRFQNPWDYHDKYRGLATLRKLVRDSDQLQPEIRLWADHGLRAVLETPGLTLDEALGLKPRAGRRRFHEQRKQDLIRAIGGAVPGSKTRRAERVAAILRGESEVPEGAAQAALEELKRYGRLPGSAREVLHIFARSESALRNPRLYVSRQDPRRKAIA